MTGRFFAMSNSTMGIQWDTAQFFNGHVLLHSLKAAASGSRCLTMINNNSELRAMLLTRRQLRALSCPC